MATMRDAYKIALRNPEVTARDVTEGDRPRQSRITVIDGYKFQSGGEAARYMFLKILQSAGEIESLSVHPKYDLLELLGAKVHAYLHDSVATWSADFAYQQISDPGLYVIEDYKGYMYRSFRVKIPFILSALHDKHIFINTKVDGWYRPEEQVHPTRRK